MNQQKRNPEQMKRRKKAVREKISKNLKKAHREKKWKKYIEDNILVKRGKGFIISGGGKILLWFIHIHGSRRKYAEDLKKRKDLKSFEYLKQFLRQEKKYGIKLIIENVEKAGADFENFNIIALKGCNYSKLKKLYDKKQKIEEQIEKEALK